LTALVGLGSESAEEESVEFVAMADGKEIWRSGKLTKSDGPKPATLEISGVHRLILRVESGSSAGAERAGGRKSQTRIQAAWVDAVLSKKN
jgi:hypothetical protein